ncbi:unnamed protein product [Ectocarpus sp. 12 AP-2014]
MMRAVGQGYALSVALLAIWSMGAIPRYQARLDGTETAKRARERELGDDEDAIAFNKHDCPYAITNAKVAQRQRHDSTIEGNVVKVTHLQFGRTGNRFMAVYRNLALGYCCKSKQVWLPPKDDVLAPGIFNEGTPGPRWFDFSSAPDVEGVDLGRCPNDIIWENRGAMQMAGLDNPERSKYLPHIRDCMAKAPRLLGCEAAYYFPQDIAVCPRKKKPFLALGDRNPPGGAGNLVLHVRSGDIFFDRVVPYKGQPPLQFYLLLMEDQPWDRIDIVTNGQHWDNVNPVVPALMAMRATGALPDNVYFHTERSMGEDLQSMLCADSLGVAKSSLVNFLSYHSTANRVYYPWRCNHDLRELARLRPKAKVYGLQLDRSGSYSVYRHWENTPDQRAEMLGYNVTTTFQRCI